MKNKSYFIILFSLVFFSFIKPVFSQYKIIRTESFDGSQYLPFGWISGKISGTDVNNYTERVIVGTAPVCGTHSGAGMIRYRSGFMFNAGEQTFIASPKFDLTNNPGTATVSFWMYRDNTSPTFTDSVTLYVNNNPSLNGTKSKAIGPVSRVSGAAGAWAQFTAIIPAGFNTSSAYFIFVFTNRETAASANIYIDDFAVETYPKPSILVSSTLFFQSTTNVPVNSIDNLIIGIKVIVDGAGDSLHVDSISMIANGSTSPLTDIVANGCKLWFTKGTSSFNNSAGNQFGSGITPAFSRNKFTQPNYFLENGENYFWLTYSIAASPPATPLNFVDADFVGIYYRRVAYFGADTSRAPVISAIAGGRQIGVSYCSGTNPALAIGTSWLNGSYTNNDYINRVYLNGAHAIIPAYPYIDNNMNDVGPNVAPWNGGPAPFTVQPPSYQQMPISATGLHPNINAVLVQGSTYTAAAAGPTGQGLALQCGTWSSSNYMAAWIDFNKDGDFLDAGEQIIQSGPMNAITWCYSPVNVPPSITAPTPNVSGPAGIQYGNVRLRVREAFATTNINACSATYSYGETEDYIVSIVPACPGGVKLWLGFTDDWNTPSNWCGGVPTLNDIALIDETPPYFPTPYEPVIHSGISATAKTVRISDIDTLTANAPQTANLQITDSLAISYNTPLGGNGKLIIKAAYSDTAQLANGDINLSFTPFMGTRRQQRSQLIYTKNELLAKGMIARDVIDQLIFYFMNTPGVATGFGNLSIKYATVDSTWGSTKFASPAVALAPATSPYVTIYNNAAFTIPALPVSGGPLAITLIPNTFIWNGVSDIVLEICYDRGALASAASDHFLLQTQTTGSNQYLRINSSTAAPSGCAMTLPVVLPAVAIAVQFRPNITFVYHRPYSRFRINITGNGAVTAGRWVNNGTFSAGNSIVMFDNPGLNQEIGGANVTTFSNLIFNKTGTLSTQKLLMQLNVNVDSSITLSAGFLDLNQKTLTINYGLPSAISRTSGWILSETTSPNYGSIKWNIGTNTSLHVFPFGTGNNSFPGNFIPVEFTKTTVGDIGNVSMATYKTSASNIPYPAAVPPYSITVNHMRSQATGLDISTTDVIDRFWQINRSVPGTSSATIKFSYVPGVPAAGEEPTGGPYTYIVQRFQAIGGTGSLSGGWINLGGTNVSGSVTATIAADSISGPWTLTNISHPLPVELLFFDAMAVNNAKVNCSWVTASEFNSDYFDVERSRDGNSFEKIGKIYGARNSNTLMHYSFVDEQPFNGISYYKIKLNDLNGGFTYSKTIAVNLTSSQEISVQFFPNPVQQNAYMLINGLDLSRKPIIFVLCEMSGKKLFEKNIQSMESTGDGLYKIDRGNIAAGIYFYKLYDKEIIIDSGKIIFN